MFRLTILGEYVYMFFYFYFMFFLSFYINSILLFYMADGDRIKYSVPLK